MKNVMIDRSLVFKVGKNLGGSMTPLAMKIREIAKETACGIRFKKYVDNPKLIEKGMADERTRRPLAKALCRQITEKIGRDSEYYVDGKNALIGEKSMVAHFSPRGNQSRTIFIDFNRNIGGAEISLDKGASFTKPDVQLAHAVISGGTLSRKVRNPPTEMAEMNPDVAMAALAGLLKSPEIAAELKHLQENSLIRTYVTVNRLRRPLLGQKPGDVPNPETLGELRALHVIADAIVESIPYMNTIREFLNQIR